jgi:hypothetical protein
MKVRIKALLTSYLVCLFFFGCDKNSIALLNMKQNDIPSILTYFNAVTKPVDAYFGITTSSPMLFDKGIKLTVEFKCVVYGPDKKPANVGAIEFGGKNFLPNSNNSYHKHTDWTDEDLGKTFVIHSNTVPLNANALLSNRAITLGDNSNSTTINDSFYAPKQLVMTHAKRVDIGYSEISIGDVFKWQTDEKNSNKGIIVLALYEPTNVENNLFNQQYPKNIQNGIVVPDNGSYILDESLFKGMPKGVLLNIRFIRGNYKIGQTISGKDYMLYAYSQKWFDYKYK